MRLKGKIAVITGAGSGIGKATAKLFAEEGAKVVVADINPHTGEEVAHQIKEERGEAIFVQVDVAHSADVQRMIQTALDSYGRIDILFNNAGIAGELWDETTEEKWQKVINVNLTGSFLACMYAIPHMRKQGGGIIINTGSIGGIRASGKSPAYAASKGGLIVLSKSLARVLAKDNIRVNCLCPGAVDTGLTEAFMGYPKTEEERRTKTAAKIAGIPLGRVSKPEEIAFGALFLASDESSFVTGAAFQMDGGQGA